MISTHGINNFKHPRMQSIESNANVEWHQDQHGGAIISLLKTCLTHRLHHYVCSYCFYLHSTKHFSTNVYIPTQREMQRSKQSLDLTLCDLEMGGWWMGKGKVLSTSSCTYPSKQMYVYLQT